MVIKSCMTSLGKEISEVIRKKGVSRYCVSKDLGIAQESLLRSLKDGAHPRWKTITKVPDYLGDEIRFVKKKAKRR